MLEATKVIVLMFNSLKSLLFYSMFQVLENIIEFYVAYDETTNSNWNQRKEERKAEMKRRRSAQKAAEWSRWRKVPVPTYLYLVRTCITHSGLFY